MNSGDSAALAEISSVWYFWSMFMVTVAQVSILSNIIINEKSAELDVNHDNEWL